MKLKLNFTILLSLVFVLSACGSAGNPQQTEPSNVAPIPVASETPSIPEQTSVVAVATDPPMTSTEESAPTEEVPPPAPTSRGPDLEATNPSMVTLASGNLQLVEFFRFT